MQVGAIDFLRFESSKFGDLPSIIMKLDKQGYISEIYNLFLKLYEEEASFTLQVDHIWGNSNVNKQARGKENVPEHEQTKKVAIPKKPVQKKLEKKKVESNPQSQGDQRVTLVNTPDPKGLSSRPDSNFSKSNVGTSSHGSSPKDSKLRSGSPSLTHLSIKNKEFMDWNNRSTGIKGTGSKPAKQSKRSINLNPNPASPLYTILYGDKISHSQSTGNLHRAEISQINQIDRSNNSNLFDRSSVSNISQLKNVNQSGLSMMKSNASGNSTARNKSGVSVQSEFNQVKGPVTFPTSQRQTIEINEMSPGPAAYNSEKSSPSRMRRSPSPSFGKAAKGSWIDIVATLNPSPGPGQLYPSHQFVSK